MHLHLFLLFLVSSITALNNIEDLVGIGIFQGVGYSKNGNGVCNTIGTENQIQKQEHSVVVSFAGTPGGYFYVDFWKEEWVDGSNGAPGYLASNQEHFLFQQKSIVKYQSDGFATISLQGVDGGTDWCASFWQVTTTDMEFYLVGDGSECPVSLPRITPSCLNLDNNSQGFIFRAANAETKQVSWGTHAGLLNHYVNVGNTLTFVGGAVADTRYDIMDCVEADWEDCNIYEGQCELVADLSSQSIDGIWDLEITAGLAGETLYYATSDGNTGPNERCEEDLIYTSVIVAALFEPPADPIDEQTESPQDGADGDGGEDGGDSNDESVEGDSESGSNSSSTFVLHLICFISLLVVK